MRKIFCFILFILTLFDHKSFSQIKHFILSGKIEYTKTVNAYAIINRQINKDNDGFSASAFEHYKNENPKFRYYKSNLIFNSQKSLFTPSDPPEPAKDDFFGGESTMGQNSIIYSDLMEGRIVDQKKVYEETFLVKDSTRKINWKITDETRVIAGYTCRRANALILDSIYVVAFYSDQIPLPSGPELFSGLPGMILEVALPHENISWVASSITESIPANANILPPIKGKLINFKGFKTSLLSVMKNWGSYAQSALKAFLL